MIGRKELYRMKEDMKKVVETAEGADDEDKAYSRISGIAKILGGIMAKAGRQDLAVICDEIRDAADARDAKRTDKAIALLQKQGRTGVLAPIMATVRSVFMASLSTLRAGKETKASAESFFDNFSKG